MRRSFWVLCARQSGPTPTLAPALSVGEASGGAAAVFSSKQEAGEFFRRRVLEGQWWLRELRAEEGSSGIDALLGGYERVALDPPPEIEDRAMDGLVSVSRKEFVERLAQGAGSVSSGTTGGQAARTITGRKTMNENVAEPEDIPPAFSAPVRDEQGAPVVEVHGEIDLATVPRLLEAIGTAGSRMDGLPIAVVDLRQAGFIDVTGVRTLLEQARAIKKLGGELRLVIPEEGPVGHVFELLGVDRVLDLYHDLDLSLD